MKQLLRVLTITCIVLYIAAFLACGGSQTTPKTEPPKPEPGREPSIEDLRKPVSQDVSFFKAVHVIKEYGRKTKEYMSFDKYQSEIAGKGGALDAEWFYDTFVLDLNDKGYWATVTFGTSKRAVERDERIKNLVKDLPERSIYMKLKVPSGRTYLLTDAEADGVVDFVSDPKKKGRVKIDIQLLDKMQEKYTWLMNIIKKNYKKK